MFKLDMTWALPSTSFCSRRAVVRTAAAPPNNAAATSPRPPLVKRVQRRRSVTAVRSCAANRSLAPSHPHLRQQSRYNNNINYAKSCLFNNRCYRILTRPLLPLIPTCRPLPLIRMHRLRRLTLTRRLRPLTRMHRRRPLIPMRHLPLETLRRLPRRARRSSLKFSLHLLLFPRVYSSE